LLRLQPLTYIRQCYDEIFGALINTFEGKIKRSLSPKIYLTGTPGIGKTAFIPYLIFKLLELNKEVVLISNCMIDALYWTGLDSPPQEFSDYYNNATLKALGRDR